MTSAMFERMTQPTVGRLALWVVLSLLWFMFLVQALVHQDVEDTYIPGAIFWAVVQAWLIWMATITWRRRRSLSR